MVNTPSVLEMNNISKTYPQGEGAPLYVLHGASLAVKRGEIVGLVGASGSGKTTFLNIAGLLDVPSDGTVAINGQRLIGNDVQRTRIRGTTLGFVYQFHYLISELTAIENVMMPLLIQNKSYDFARKRAATLLEHLSLSHRLEHLPAMLSGGEQQRVAVARALSTSPHLLLADEPTGNLDLHTSFKVFDEILSLVREENMAALIVTHDPSLMKKMDRVLTFSEGELIEMEE